MSKLRRAVMASGCAAVFCIFAFFASPIPEKDQSLVFTVLFASLLWASVYFALRHTGSDGELFSSLFVCAALTAGFCVRILCMTVRTYDYIDFLKPWAQAYREHGWGAMQMGISNYNMPYQYFIALFARIPLNDLYLYKLLSVICDCGIVLSGLRIAEKLRLNETRRAVLCAALFLLPTVWLNSALWAQCDAIYALFAILSIMFAVEDRPVLSVAMAALSFAFKLQSVFFLPLLAVFWFTGRLKFKHFFVFPVVYIVSILPAWVTGTSLSDIFSVYSDQTGIYSSRLNLNSPSFFALPYTNADNHGFWFAFGLAAAFLFMLAVLGYALYKRRAFDNNALVICALVLCAGIPWLLPSMHERYFYLSDLLCVIVAVMLPRRWYLAPLGLFASLAGYCAYLTGKYLPIQGSMAIPAVCLLFVIIISVIALIEALNKPEKALFET